MLPCTWWDNILKIQALSLHGSSPLFTSPFLQLSHETAGRCSLCLFFILTLTDTSCFLEGFSSKRTDGSALQRRNNTWHVHQAGRWQSRGVQLVGLPCPYQSNQCRRSDALTLISIRIRDLHVWSMIFTRSLDLTIHRFFLTSYINSTFSPCVMHNGDCDGSPERSGLVSCGHWMMPMLWSGGRADKISNKPVGDVVCLSGPMVEHQPRLLGSQVRFPPGAFAIFSVSAKASLPISLSLSPFPFPLPSSILRIYPI